MITCNSERYARFLERAWDKKVPLMVYGPPGIGKSQVPREFFNDLNSKSGDGRRYSEWAALSKEEKLDAISNPQKYFIFADMRIAGMDATDLRGLPKLESEYIVSTPYSWVSYFTSPGSKGVIFFDEINLAPPMIAAQAYEIILDRTIADRRLSDGVLVIGAGNRAKDAAYTYPMPAPLKDRFCEIELVCEQKAWVEWASKHHVNPYLVAFINWKEKYLHTLSDIKVGEEKGSTPRGIVRASTLIEGMKITDDFVFDLISSSCGEEFAVEFNGFINVFKELSWDELFADPTLARKLGNDKCWAVCGGLEEQFIKDKNNIEKILQVAFNLKRDFAVVAIMILYSNHKAEFLKAIRGKPSFRKIATDYGFVFMES